MKKKSNTRVFSILAAASAFVAIMCMFANIFAEKVDSGEGNIFVAMFGMHNSECNVVWPIVGGFVALIILVLVGLVGFILGDSGKKVIPFIEIVLGIAIGVLFFFVIDFYIAASGDDVSNFYAAHPEISLGAGTICVIVFSFLSAALGFLNIFADRNTSK